MTWQIVYEHIVTDAYRSKKSSSVLIVHEQQAFTVYKNKFIFTISKPSFQGKKGFS